MRAGKAMRKAIKDIVCAYAYPRLDMEVSKKMNHLLKVGAARWSAVLAMVLVLVLLVGHLQCRPDAGMSPASGAALSAFCEQEQTRSGTSPVAAARACPISSG